MFLLVFNQKLESDENYAFYFVYVKKRKRKSDEILRENRAQTRVMQLHCLHKTYPKTVVFEKADDILSVALGPNVIPSNEINTPTVYFEVKEEAFDRY